MTAQLCAELSFVRMWQDENHVASHPCCMKKFKMNTAPANFTAKTKQSLRVLLPTFTAKQNAVYVITANFHCPKRNKASTYYC